MKDYAYFTCPECDHTHELEMHRGEYPSDDYAELPECCESCGESFLDYEPLENDSQSERRQMGIE